MKTLLKAYWTNWRELSNPDPEEGQEKGGGMDYQNRLDLDKNYGLSKYIEVWRCQKCGVPLWGNCITVSLEGKEVADGVECGCGEINQFKT